MCVIQENHMPYKRSSSKTFHCNCIPDDRPIKIKLPPYLIYSACVQCQLLSLRLFFFLFLLLRIRRKRRKCIRPKMERKIRCRGYPQTFLDREHWVYLTHTYNEMRRPTLSCRCHVELTYLTKDTQPIGLFIDTNPCRRPLLKNAIKTNYICFCVILFLHFQILLTQTKCRDNIFYINSFWNLCSNL